MDWQRSYRIVATGVRGDVLAVLTTGVEPMTGREIARRAGASQQAARTALDDLEAQGLVSVREVPPSYLYEFNAEHVVAAILGPLMHLRELVYSRITEQVREWSPPPINVTVFGSVARGEATTSSDLDLLIVRPDATGPDFSYWNDELPSLADSIRRWCGNSAQILELAGEELRDRSIRGDHLVRSIRRDGRTLFGAPLDELTPLGVG